jgi:hypothetical protein
MYDWIAECAYTLSCVMPSSNINTKLIPNLDDYFVDKHEVDHNSYDHFVDTDEVGC